MPFFIQKAMGRFDSEKTLSASRTTVVRFVDGDVLRIGRGTNVNLRFDDVAVELEHAVIERREQGYFIVDAASITGTYLNGQPVRQAQLRHGDRLAIGEHDIEIELEADGRVMGLFVRPRDPATTRTSPPAALRTPGAAVKSAILEAQTGVASRTLLGRGEPAAATAKPPAAAAWTRQRRARTVNYGRSYSLNRFLFNRRALSLALVAGAVVWLGSIVSGGHSVAFRPGPLSGAHRRVIAADACSDCHAPWRGVAAERCAGCHPGPEHHVRQVTTPSCVECHIEHRFEPVLAEVENRQCVLCHSALTVADGGALVFAPSVRDFAVDHPDFSLSVPGAAGGLVRLPLATAVSEQIDRARLRLNHELHLRSELKPGSPALDCDSCHRVGADGGAMAPVVYETHCADCHPLAYDRAQPLAPHDTTSRVYEHILATYATAAGDSPSRPTSERRRLAIFRRDVQVLSVDERVERAAFSSADRLFQAACAKCHFLQSAGDWPPAVVDPAVPADWLPHAEFSHHRHRLLTCNACHAAARASRRTEDVLLQGIATCLPCHGGPGTTVVASADQPRTAGAATGATTECVGCHLYHARSKEEKWEALVDQDL